MDLRAKTFLIIGLTLLGGIILIILFSFTLLTDSYSRFEEDSVKQQVIKGLKVLQNEEDSLLSLTNDWSRWDESYQFVQDSYDEYILNNLNYASFENLGLDIAIFVRKDGTVRYATLFNETLGLMDTVPDKTFNQILAVPGFFTYEGLLDSHAGIIILPEGPALIASGPIITSTYEGPAVGTLVFGKYLDNKTIEQLSHVSDITLQISSAPLSNAASMGDGDFRNETSANIYVRPLSDQSIQGYTYLPTLDSRGSVNFTAFLPRDILRQGKETIVTYLIILVILGIVVIAVSLLFIDRLVLYRLHTLTERIKKRDPEGEDIHQVLLEGNDEFSTLAREIYPLFIELQQSKNDLEAHVRLLTESERKYRELADLLPEFVFESDLNGKITFLNQMGLTCSGFSPDDIQQGLAIFDLIHETDHSRFASALASIREGRSINGIEFSGVTREGNAFPLIVYASPIRSNSNITGLRGFAIDISERKKIENSLRKLADIVENTSTGIVTGSGNVVDYVNAAFLTLHGMDSAECIGKSPFLTLAGYPEKQFNPYLESALHSGHTAFEADHIRKDGSRFPALHHLTILAQPVGQDVVWALNIQDITDQRLAWKAKIESESLRESARQLRDVVSRLPDATFVIDKDGWVIFWNQAMAILTGISETEIVGRGRYEYAIPFYGEKRPMLLNAILEKGDILSTYFSDVSRSGDSLFIEETFPKMGMGGKYFSTMAGPLYDSRGGVIGAIQSMRDMTPRIMAEKALIRTNEKLNLLSSITRHDIRNRVSVILGLIPLLKEARNDPDTAEIIKIVDTAARLIHDQIEFTRVYQDLGIHSPEWKPVQDLLSKVSEIGVPDRITVENNLSQLVVYADPLLERVFYNLIDNAIRHGGASISFIRFSWYSNDEGATILCEDDGTGIADDLKERIFDRGYGSNTGLGLFLVREILSITGITIVETGSSGTGARFEIRIPIGGYAISEKKE